MLKNLFLLGLAIFLLVITSGKASAQSSSVGKTIHLTYDEFMKKVANVEANPNEWNYLGSKPAIIDFYADWCGPCKQIAPILEKLAGEYAEEIVVYKINTDKEKELSSMFGIRSIPTLIFVPMKGKPTISQGALPEDALRQSIDELLLGKE